jgi:putative ABC transport system permease protein
MTLADLLRESLRSLRAHALRFALTGLGMVWGVAMLTFLLAAVDGFETNFDRQLEKVGQRAIFLFPGSVSRAAVGQRNARPVEPKLEDLGRLEGFEGIDRAAAHVPLGARLVRAGGRSKLAWVYGVSPAALDIRGFRVGAGRGLHDQDVATHARVVFLGVQTAERLFGHTDVVGRPVHVEGIPFEVIGVSEPKNEQILYIGPADDEMAMIPITTAQRRFMRDDVVSQLVVEPRTRAGSWGASADARALLGFHHGFRAEDRGAMDDFNLEEVRQIVAPLYLGVRLFLTAASLITLCVGAVGVMNIMLVVVRERTKEIGLRKSIGGSNGAIFAQFLAETMLVCLAAGGAGALLGVTGVAVMTGIVGEGSVVNAPPLLLPERVALVLLSLVGIGLAAGILPAVRAARVDPAVSLRST